MAIESRPVLFLVGRDYHLGDLLWLTPVLARYRTLRRPPRVTVGLPDRDISRILEHAPSIDRLIYGTPRTIQETVRAEFNDRIVVQDLRSVSVGIRMVRGWRRKLPWTYYSDLWLRPRGQWLSTFLGLGELTDFKPRIKLSEDDLPGGYEELSPYIVLAPHIGNYSLPGVSHLWLKLKGWDAESWAGLARLLEHRGYKTITLGAAGQATIDGTVPALGLRIRQAAALVERASALVTGESGMWFIAAALETPFVIVPWWLPSGVDWPAPMKVDYQLVSRREASPARVCTVVQQLISHEA